MTENQTVPMTPFFANIVEKLNNLVHNNSVLYLINDDYVSGDLAIQALINELAVSRELAYGYVMQANYKNKSLIYKGSTKDCERIAVKLRQYGLTTLVEKED